MSGNGKAKALLPAGAAFALLLGFSAPIEAAKICGWLVESNEPNDVRSLDLWLESDEDIDFLYKIGGDGIVTDSGKSNSPASATYTLAAGKPSKAWGFGSTLGSAGKIDVSVELHQTPDDIFSNAPTPLLARFVFQRNIPASEKQPPMTLSKRQCATVPGR